MERKVFNLGDGLSLNLYDCGDVYFGHVNINVWRKLMPSYTLRSGLDSYNGDMYKKDYRYDEDYLHDFLYKLSMRLNREVFPFNRSHIGNVASIIEKRGGDLDSGLMITIFKDM